MSFCFSRYFFDVCIFFFFNDTAPTEIYTLSLHDALPIWRGGDLARARRAKRGRRSDLACGGIALAHGVEHQTRDGDRKSTRLNSSHSQISYAVFCLKKKKKKNKTKK